MASRSRRGTSRNDCERRLARGLPRRLGGWSGQAEELPKAEHQVFVARLGALSPEHGQTTVFWLSRWPAKPGDRWFLSRWLMQKIGQGQEGSTGLRFLKTIWADANVLEADWWKNRWKQIIQFGSKFSKMASSLCPYRPRVGNANFQYRYKSGRTFC